MKKHILLLNIAVIIPYLLSGTSLFLPWFLVLALSVYNTCKAENEKKFLIYNLILFIASSAGISVVYYMDKVYGVGWHPEKTEEIQLLMCLHIVGMAVLTGIELLLNWIGAKHKRKVNIEKVFSDNGCLYVKPASGVYDKIYRAAMGTYWDEKVSCLYFKNTENSDKEALEKICEAVKNEYGIELYIDKSTEFMI